MVAAGIGVTPFVSQLRHLRLSGEDRDVVFVYVASDAEELAFRQDLEDAGIPVIVFTRNEPATLPSHWRWAKGVRLDADGLLQVVPDIGARHAYLSARPALHRGPRARVGEGPLPDHRRLLGLLTTLRSRSGTVSAWGTVRK